MRGARGAATCAVLLAVASPAGAQAQESPLDRGVWLVGGIGRIYGTHDLDEDTRRFVIDLNPRLGYFVARHLAVHANLAFTYSSAAGGVHRSAGVGPGLSYYFGGPRSRLLPYLTARTLFVWTRSGPADDASSVARYRQWLAGGGISWLVSRNVGLTAEAYYLRTILNELERETGDSATESYALDFGVTVFAF
jgi:hypothetical protein